MKGSSPAAAGLALLALGCGDVAPTNSEATQQTNSVGAAQANAAGSSPPRSADKGSQALVAGFSAPALEGLAVRDHAEGAQVVTPPSSRGTTPPPLGIDRTFWAAYAPGSVIVAVNERPVRNAAHFRDMMNDAFERNDDVSIEVARTLRMRDAGDGWVTLEVLPTNTQ